MRAVGHCAGNAAAEGFFGMLKRERVNRCRYATIPEARRDMFNYIERSTPHESAGGFRQTITHCPKLSRPQKRGRARGKTRSTSQETGKIALLLGSVPNAV